jgi:F-type H+-transporting ATPase subunit alpha
MSILQDAVEHTLDGVRQALENFKPLLTTHETGIVRNVSTGIATVSGLPGVGYEELVRFSVGVLGIAFNVDEDE